MTIFDIYEKAAKEEFAKLQNNPEYEFEVSELAGYISNGILENVYKQAFFAAMAWARENVSITFGR